MSKDNLPLPARAEGMRDARLARLRTTADDASWMLLSDDDWRLRDNVVSGNPDRAYQATAHASFRRFFDECEPGYIRSLCDEVTRLRTARDSGEAARLTQTAKKAVPYLQASSRWDPDARAWICQACSQPLQRHMRHCPVGQFLAALSSAPPVAEATSEEATP